MKRWKRDVIYSSVLIVACILNIIYASNIKQKLVSEPLAKPGVYVMLWLILLLFCSIVVLIRAIVKKPQEILSPLWDNLQVLTLGSLVIYILVIKILGTFISSFLLLSVLFISYSFRMGKIKKDKKDILFGIAKYSMLGLVVSFITVQVFTIFLNASLPTFSLF